MTAVKKEKTKSLKITESTHKKAKDFIGVKIKIGAFADEAIIEKIEKEKTKK